ncbi:Pyruvate/Phosphoenolpyruvate kinase-like domain-containing protein [Flagelloscypha sp. PMI_526]|nr:Pyruvate/Phosphoenolpyruvate kinase-like domain-containing protein [Flagelloscypha sp. PMI_526]
MQRVASSVLHRSYLYVPASSSRMLQKSLTAPADVLIYDLEDSVAPNAKNDARSRLAQFLEDNKGDLAPKQFAVRINDTETSFFKPDIDFTFKSGIKTIVLPKVHSEENLRRLACHASRPTSVIASIESARAMYNLGAIAKWKTPKISIGALLFAAEDYCADTSIIRTPSRLELLYTRSQIVIAAKAFGLEAIDMVCVNYKDDSYLKEECEDGRRLGFTGKQAIHPSQIETINHTFVPTPKEIDRAARILHAMTLAHSSEADAKGAVGLDGEMIDAPMLKQAESTISAAKAAGLEIPDVRENSQT